MFKAVLFAALVASVSAGNKTAKFAFDKPDLLAAKEEIIDAIESKINATKFLVHEAEETVKDASLKAEAMEKLTHSLKAVNLTKLKALKNYTHSHPSFPKANLTLVKPVLKLDILKPNKTALKMEVEHMIVKDTKYNY